MISISNMVRRQLKPVMKVMMKAYIKHSKIISSLVHVCLLTIQETQNLERLSKITSILSPQKMRLNLIQH